MKLFLLIISLILTLAATANTQVTPRVKALVRIEKTPKGVHVFTTENGDYIPTIIGNEEVKKFLGNLQAGSEAVIEGEIKYEMKSSESIKQIKPFFIINKIHLISLRDLGVSGNYRAEPINLLSEKNAESYAPLSIPVTTEVASAITMTTSLLLMESLSAGNGDPQGRRDVTKALFISSGVLATLLFIYDQIEGKTKP